MVSTARDRTLVRNAETLIDPVELVVFVSRILIDVFETRTIMIFLAGRSFFSGCPPPFHSNGRAAAYRDFYFCSQHYFATRNPASDRCTPRST